jgi:tetratricopeptide (TPR) repeat protein
LLLPVLLAAAAGCSRSVAWLDRRDASADNMRAARAREAEGDVDGAIAMYRKALNSEARLARGHLDLALLLHHEKQDYFAALCHYQRYLDMRPGTQKRQLIEGRMQRALQEWHAARKEPGGDSPSPEHGRELADALDRVRRAERSGKALQDRLAAAETENRRLAQAVARLQASLDRARSVVVTPAPTASGGSAEAPPANVTRTYRVRRGDSLSSIADDVYGDSQQWRKIFEANREQLGDSPEIKIGQVLEIP